MFKPASYPVLRKQRGFTLIELSIVLVIFGLLAGGVFVGLDLINAAKARSAITQIGSFNTAANQFEATYGGLPGDASMSKFAQFVARPGTNRQGDQNHVVEPWVPNYNYQCGEVVMFWDDLANADLIKDVGGNLATVSTTNTCVPSTLTGSSIGNFFPKSPLDGVYVALGSEGGINENPTAGALMKEMGTFYILTGFNRIENVDGRVNADHIISPEHAYKIDSKTDDGKPTTGKVRSVRKTGNATYNASLLYVGQDVDCYVDNGGDANPIILSAGDPLDTYNIDGDGDNEADLCSLIIQTDF